MPRDIGRSQIDWPVADKKAIPTNKNPIPTAVRRYGNIDKINSVAIMAVMMGIESMMLPFLRLNILLC